MPVVACGRCAARDRKQGSKKEPFTFVQIADPQLGFCDKGQDWRWTVDNLKATVARVNELKPAFVIVTGDLIHNHKNAEQARAYRENIALIDASIPVFHIPATTTFPSTGPKPWRSTSTNSVTTASRSPTTVLHSSG